jgi:transposase
VKRLPHEAYSYYVELGTERNYEAVAKHFGVSKVTVVNHATKERWQERLREAEGKAREEANKKAVDTLQAVKERQLQEARILERRALEALKTLPPEKASKAAAMLNIAWKHELFLLGEPSERTELTVEEVTKREIETLLKRVDVEEPDGDEE